MSHGKGYIKLYRGLQDCWIWQDKEPFTKRDAWIDLLLSANHADRHQSCFARKPFPVSSTGNTFAIIHLSLYSPYCFMEL